MAVPLAQFVKHLADSGLMSADEIASFEKSLSPGRLSPGDAQEFARELIRRKKLTAFQAQKVYRGKSLDLVLGNYVLLDELGKGGMGQVFKAEHRRMKRVVAVKVISQAAMKSPDAVKRFNREVQAAAKLTHPNIVATFDADKSRDVHFMVMEYVEGSDLATLVRKHGPLSAGKAIDCIAQAARGLEHAHSQGVVHRDIKPANLLIDREGNVKILDMGLARIDESLSGAAGTAAGLTQSGSIMGTVDYMSPEQALNTKYADRRADIYSLGCSLHYLVTSRPVYAGETLMEKLLAHREQPIPSLTASNPAVPAALDDVFSRMVAKNAPERYQTMGEVLRDLERVAAGAPVTAPLLPGGDSGEDAAVREFLAAISPAASGTELRTKVRRPASETLVSQTAANTQTSLLRSAAKRVSTLSALQKLIAAGGAVGVLLVIGMLILNTRSKPTTVDRSSDTAGVSPKDSRKKETVESQADRKPGDKSAGAAAYAPPLFKNDINGWRALPGLWRVENGTLIGSTQGQPVDKNTCLCSPRSYHDFELSFMVRLKDGRGNSGVQIRSRLIDPDKFIVAGPQVDIGGQYWGLLYGELTDGVIHPPPQLVLDKIRPSDFNEFFIRCTDRHVFVRVNGAVSIDDDFPDMSDSGIIAWQLHAGDPMEVEFRDVALRELNATDENAGKLSGAGDAKDWVNLFNGKDLKGWKVLGTGQWRVESGALTTFGDGKGWLMSDAEFADFELELEYKLPPAANSGIFLRAWPEGDVSGSQFLEIQLLDDAAPVFQSVAPKAKNGAIFAAAAPDPEPNAAAGQWNHVEILAQGRNVQVFINGQRVQDANLDDFHDQFARFPGFARERGHIGLQDYAPGIQFRNIRARELAKRR